MVITSIFMLMSLLLMVYIFIYKENYVIKSASPIFCFVIISGAMITYATVFFLNVTPTDFVCTARAWFLSVGFGLLYS